MVKTGKISLQEADEAKKQDTTTIGQAMKPRRDSMLAPHFAMYVLEQIADEYGEEKIQKEGLKITTTLDYEKQKAAEQSISEGVPKLSKYNASNAALVAVDPKNGQVLAMVGSKDYFDVSIDGNVNVADSLRQPGSSFKPFAYATAFKKPEYSPSKILYDFQTDFGGGYVPHNYNGKSNGPVTMRVALSNSLNIPAVKVMALAGMDNVIKTASDMGITTLTQRDRYGLSLVLGSGEVKPVEMAGAYSVFANGGTKNPTTPILKITDSKGKTLYDFEKDRKKSKQVLDPQIAYEISSILSDNNARSVIFGAHSALYFPNRTVAAKTGTTNDFKDAWTMGYTPSLAVAVWTGNSNAAKMKNGADGSVVAAPIFHNFIEKALANVPNEEFTRPDGIKDIAVEKYSNKLPNSYSKETVTDIFAEWQVPKEQDDVHKIFRVCRGTNKLAPENMDPSLAEERVLTNIHSEMPDNPNWEGPVRAWAEANGMTSAVPTETCDANSFNSTISITSPTSGTVSGQINIEASVNSAYPVKTVEFFVDDISIGSSSKSPYSIPYDFSNTSSGSHKLSAIATDINNVTTRADIPIKVESSLPLISAIKPKLISNLPLSYEITWNTDRPTTGDVTYRANTGPSQTISSKANSTSHSVVLSGLLHGATYYFTVQVADGSQNTNSFDGSFTTPLNSEFRDDKK
jgi:membrane peptidoglycan carboxypeptidase